MNLGIEGKRALVIGASKDSGRAVTHALHRAGCTVVAVARTTGGTLGLQVERYISLDMMQDGAIDELLPLVRERGEPDIIIHVIGGSLGVKDPLAGPLDWQRVWRLNLGNAIAINAAFLPGMVERGWGRIVHFSSNATTLHIGAPAYASAKHAVEGYVRTMGRVYAPNGVVISAVRPGPIYTNGRFLYSQDESWERDFHEKYLPIKRWGLPEEIANVVVFLCSRSASYMPGAIVDVNGGMR